MGWNLKTYHISSTKLRNRGHTNQKGQDYLENWKADITELAKHPNVYMKLSGMVVLAAETWSKEIFQPYIDHCIKEFGVKRYVLNT